MTPLLISHIARSFGNGYLIGDTGIVNQGTRELPCFFTSTIFKWLELNDSGTERNLYQKTSYNTQKY